MAKKKSPLILVVEDNPNHMRLTCDLLKAKGFRCLQANSCESVFETLAGNRPDLILMDISLKGINGLTIVARLKSDPSTREIPVVIVSAHAMQQDRENAKEAQCDGFIAKPINTRTLAGQIMQVLNNKKGS